MNAITSFRLCTLSNEELINRVDKMTDEMYQTGKIPSRNIPARPDQDYDLLIGELLVRCKEKILNDFSVPQPKHEVCENCNKPIRMDGCGTLELLCECGL